MYACIYYTYDINIHQNSTVTATILWLRSAEDFGVGGGGEDQFYYWRVLESLVHVENKRQTNTTPVPGGRALTTLGGHCWTDEGRKQGSMLEYTPRTAAGKEELRPEITVCVVCGVKLCLVVSFHVFMLCPLDSTNIFRALPSRVAWGPQPCFVLLSTASVLGLHPLMEHCIWFTSSPPFKRVLIADFSNQ